MYPLERDGGRVTHRNSFSEYRYVLKKGMFDSDPPGFWGSKPDPAAKRSEIFRDSLVYYGPRIDDRDGSTQNDYDVPRLWTNGEVADPLSGLAKFLKDGTAFRHNAKKYVVIVDDGHLPFYKENEWSRFFAGNRGVTFILLSSRRSAVPNYPAGPGKFKWIPFCRENTKPSKKLADYIAESYGHGHYEE